MNLYDLIQKIPAFISSHLKSKPEPAKMLGHFHLGLRYDMSTWQSSNHSPVFPCQWERPIRTKKSDMQQAPPRYKTTDLSAVVTD
jgi:hypothetical protein